MENPDIRWKQRFLNFKKAYERLHNGVDQEEYSELELQGLIKAFEFTYELAWNTLRDYLIYSGYTDLTGSRDTIKLAFKAGLIENGVEWMEMIQTRNLTSHTYDEDTAKEVEELIKEKYYLLFKALMEKMSEKYQEKI